MPWVYMYIGKDNRDSSDFIKGVCQEVGTVVTLTGL